MAAIHAMFTLYYLCDTAAAHGVLSHAEMARCMANYDAITLEMAGDSPAPPGSAQRAARNAEGYRAFKDWERANPGRVARYRAEARRRLGL